jgi:SAM-dependent methyltransferase
MPNTLQDIVGLDPSKKMLDVLKRNAELSGRNTLCIRGVGELIPLRDSCFNMILCKDVLDHICSLPQLFHEFIRTLSCGGLLLVAQSIPDFKMIDDTHTILLSERLIIRYLEDEFTLIKHVRLNGPFLRLMVRLLPIITKHAIVLLTKIDQISIRLAKHASYHIFISEKGPMRPSIIFSSQSCITIMHNDAVFYYTTPNQYIGANTRVADNVNRASNLLRRKCHK